MLLEFDGLVAAGWGGGAAPPALLEAMPVAPLPAAVVPTPAAVEARDPSKIQQRLVLDAVWQGKIPWRKRDPTW